ncbi:hypothetical protein ABA45_00685 [Marinobacter psychrophilus]|uniref:Uncharacterized protein n=1 Tax=Marinobacter psychrophilus TaxID=330734 RepID=A0A0H4HWN8_9GAMM|nr:DUF748 domain-containing protein [Marinobacter psychrophilus]AKO51119.1 hypothetical protein ABA45_00685 [Marinobacter psychrophilus]
MAERPVRQIRQRNVWPRLAVVVLIVLLLCYALGGFLLLPWWVQKNLPHYAQQQLGWQATVGEVHANPFTFSAELRNLQANDASGEPVLAFQRLYVNLSAFDLFNGTTGFQAVELEQPMLRLDVLASGQLNLMRDWQQAPARAGQSSDTTDIQSDTVPGSLRIYLQQGDLSAGTLVLRDFNKNSSVEFRITPLTFSLQNLATWARPGDIGQYRLEAVLDQQALSWQGSFEVDPMYSRGSLSVDNLGPGVLSYLLAPYMPFQLRSGRVSLNTDYQWQAAQPMELLTQHGKLTFDDATLALAAEPSEVAFRSGALTVDQIRFDLAARRIEVGKIEFDGPELNLNRSANGDIDWLVADVRPAGEGFASRYGQYDSSPEFRWSVAGMNIRDGQLSWRDQVPANIAELQLNDLNLSLGAFTDHFDEPVNYRANAVLASGGSLDVNGQFTTRPFNLEMAVVGNELALPAFAPYVQQRMAIELPAGLLSVDGSLNLDQQRLPLTGTFNGSASVTGLDTRLPGNGQPLLAWQTLQLAPIEYNVNPARLEIGRVTLIDLAANITRNDDGSHDITHLLTLAPAGTPTAAAANENQGFIFRIGELQLDNADVDFTDRTLTPELTTRFGQLQGNFSGLSNIPPQQGRVSLKGKVNQVGNLDMNGLIATLGTDQQSDLVLNLENLELPRLSPYFGRYLGYGIAGGKLDLKLDYQLQGTRINASNQIILNRLELGQPMPSEQAIGGPIKLGLALLRDDNNVIELNVPVNGDLADPKFQMGKVMMRSFVDALTKAATSPFAQMGTLTDIAGLGGEQLHQVSFAPGGMELTATSTRKLAALAQVLNQKTELILSIRGAAAPEADTGVGAGAPSPGALADNRAVALRQLLVNTHGVNSQQIVVSAPETDASVDANGNIAVNFTLDAR